MYQITEKDMQILSHVRYADRISKLTMFEPATLAALSLHHITIVADMVTIEPEWLATLDEFSDNEKEMISAVRYFLFKDILDKMHD